MILLGIACGYFLLGWFLFLLIYWCCVVQHPEEFTERVRDYFDKIDIVNFIALSIAFSILWAPIWIEVMVEKWRKWRNRKCSKKQ